MVKSGINKAALDKLGSGVVCYMSDPDVAEAAKLRSTTRAAVSMDKAVSLPRNPIFAIGNAPTALIRLYELIKAGKIKPSLIIGVPVGFVNVTQSKELIMSAGIPYIVACGRKGGSNVAAAIVNALMYQITRNGG
jgi:precorrin-8X/cobalt-precorrin-8 methylmutase